MNKESLKELHHINEALSKNTGGDKSLEEQFIEDGYVVIRNALDGDLIKKIQALTSRGLCDQIEGGEKNSRDNSYEFFCCLLDKLLLKEKPFNLLKPIWQLLIYEKIVESAFQSPSVYDFITSVLGKDLCYQDDASLTLNIPNKTDPKQNYLFKNYHQEIWSGTSIDTMHFFAPIFQTSSQGGMTLIRGSHLWGHIPHRNRKPIEMPSKIQEVETDLNLGDVILFHSLLLHKTTPLSKENNYRFALPCPVRNFRLPNNTFEMYRNWKIFSLSAQTTIQKKLGNHYLSPFRIIDLENQSHTDGSH